MGGGWGGEEVKISHYKAAGETGSVLCRFALWDCSGAIACFIGY